jgi:transposase
MAGVVPVHRGKRADDRQQRSKRRLRDQAIGRKNWLFLGNDEAGCARRWFIRSRRERGGPPKADQRHRLEPWAYLHDVILQLSADPSRELLARLLPDRWALAHPEHVLSHQLEESRQNARRRDQPRANRPRSP